MRLDRFGLVLLCAFVAGCPAVAILKDISPDNLVNAASEASAAGLVLNLASDKQYIYAVSLNSSVWRTDGTGWNQLQTAPPLVTSIAIDPNNVNHIVVG